MSTLRIVEHAVVLTVFVCLETPYVIKYQRYKYCLFYVTVYSPDMPKRLPIKDIVSGLLGSVGKAVRYWFHYTLVTFAWLGVVPLTACKYCRIG
jgi:E3 ubiquitin-protein ligase MARCH6